MNNKNIWMKYAFRQAETAYKNDEVPIGSVVVKDDKIIGKGYNQVEILRDATAHSEIIAITSASNLMGDWRLNDCSLYVTKEPCLMCFGAIINSRIKNLYFGFEDMKNGFSSMTEGDKSLFSNHLKLVESGIMATECKAIVQDFFNKKRKNSINNTVK